MKVSQKYKEIFKLKKMLEDADIPFDFYEMDEKARKLIPEWEHWHINYPSRADTVISAIEGIGTYGEQDDKLEIMGGLTEEEADGSAVVGWLTAEDVFMRIKNHYEGRIKMNKTKTIKVVDEDTLEIKEIEVEEELTDEEADKQIAAFQNAIPCDPEEFSHRYKKLKEAQAEFDEVYEPFKANLIKLHEEMPEASKSVLVGNVKLTYVSPSTRSTIDSKKLKEEEPEIAKKFTKTTNVKATIRLEETL